MLFRRCFMFFFFFKQKTAYEMRISDWSSDVCSSDFQQAGADDDGGEEAEGAGDGDDRRPARFHQAARGPAAQRHRGDENGAEQALHPAGLQAHVEQNGRASCRARVWKSVRSLGHPRSVTIKDTTVTIHNKSLNT